MLPSADDVRTALARLDADGVPVVERYDEPEHVSFKCVDPDGWRVEVLGIDRHVSPYEI